jgi:hypothetical protein
MPISFSVRRWSLTGGRGGPQPQRRSAEALSGAGEHGGEARSRHRQRPGQGRPANRRGLVGRTRTRACPVAGLSGYAGTAPVGPRPGRRSMRRCTGSGRRSGTRCRRGRVGAAGRGPSRSRPASAVGWALAKRQPPGAPAIRIREQQARTVHSTPLDVDVSRPPGDADHQQSIEVAGLEQRLQLLIQRGVACGQDNRPSAHPKVSPAGRSRHAARKVTARIVRHARKGTETGDEDTIWHGLRLRSGEPEPRRGGQVVA